MLYTHADAACMQWASVHAGFLGASRFSAAMEAWGMDRQGSQAAASTVSAESPIGSLPAKLGSMEVFPRENAPA